MRGCQSVANRCAIIENIQRAPLKVQCFREGPYGASMQDLAERVGLKKSSLYMRFPNKEALVPAVVDLTLHETFPPRKHRKLAIRWG
jgi:AcrR family transcriptional regulator